MSGRVFGIVGGLALVGGGAFYWATSGGGTGGVVTEGEKAAFNQALNTANHDGRTTEVKLSGPLCASSFKVGPTEFMGGSPAGAGGKCAAKELFIPSNTKLVTPELAGKVRQASEGR